MALFDVLFARKVGGSGGGAEPLVVDLGKYHDQSFHGISLEGVMLALAQMSIQAGGTMQEKKIVFKDSAFRDTLSTDRQVIFRQSIDGNDYEHINYATASSCVYQGKAQFYYVAGMIYDVGDVLNAKAIFAFNDDSDTEMQLCVQAAFVETTQAVMPNDF